MGLECGVGEGEDVGVSVEFVREVNNGDEDHDGEHGVLDDGDDGGRAQAAGVGVGGEDDEGRGEGPLTMNAEGGDDDAHADELQCDVRHEGEDAGEGDGDGERAEVVTAADEVCKGDVAVAMADGPKARQDEHHVGVDKDCVGDGEKAVGAGTIKRGGDGDDSVGGVEIATEEEPGDPGTEAATCEAPFFQRMHAIGWSTPACGPESGDGDESEEEAEDEKRRGVHGW